MKWCADRSPCGICGGSIQSDSVKRYYSTLSTIYGVGATYTNLIFVLWKIRLLESALHVWKAEYLQSSSFLGMCQDTPAVLTDLTIVEKCDCPFALDWVHNTTVDGDKRTKRLLQRSFFWPEPGTNVKRMDLDVSAVSGKRSTWVYGKLKPLSTLRQRL